jgi:hypothetical protein
MEVKKRICDMRMQQSISTNKVTNRMKNQNILVGCFQKRHRSDVLFTQHISPSEGILSLFCSFQATFGRL